MRTSSAAILLAIVPALTACSTAPITPESRAEFQQFLQQSQQWNAQMATQNQQRYDQAATYQAPEFPSYQQPDGTVMVWCKELGSYAAACTVR